MEEGTGSLDAHLISKGVNMHKKIDLTSLLEGGASLQRYGTGECEDKKRGATSSGEDHGLEDRWMDMLMEDALRDQAEADLFTLRNDSPSLPAASLHTPEIGNFRLHIPRKR